MTDKIIRYEKYGRHFAGAGPLTKSLYMMFTPFGLGGDPQAFEDALKSVVEKAVADALTKAGMKPLSPEAAPAPAVPPARAPISEAWVLCPVLPGMTEREVNGEIVTDRPIAGYLEGRAHRDAGYVLDAKTWRIVVPLEALEPATDALFVKGDWGVWFAKGRIIAEGSLEEMHNKFVAERGGDFIGLADLKDVAIFKEHFRTAAKTVLSLASVTLGDAVGAITRDDCNFDWNSNGAAAIVGGHVVASHGVRDCTVVQHPAVSDVKAKTQVGSRSVVVNRTNVDVGNNSVVVLRDSGAAYACGDNVVVVAIIKGGKPHVVTLNRDERAEIVDGALKVTPAPKHEKKGKR